MILRFPVWRLSLGLLWLAAAATGLSDPTNRYVANGGSHTVPFDSWPKAATSLVTAVNYANFFNEGDTVTVSNGIYALTNTVTVNNTIVLGLSANSVDALINGRGANRCVSLAHTNAFVAGLTISNGFNASGGSGVYVALGTLSNCAVVNNLTTGIYAFGGGVRVDTGTVVNCLISRNTTDGTYNSAGSGVGLSYVGVISNCTIVNNVSKEQAENGGGGVSIGGSGIIDGCVITGNVADVIGGGIWLNGQAVARNCLISGNRTFGIYNYIDYFGGGGVAFNRGGVVSNCLITGNYSGKHGGGVYFYRGGTLRNSRVFANTSLTNGGGVCVISPYWTEMANCIVTGNTAGVTGGGVYNNASTYGNGIMRNCLIADNTATTSAGGWYSSWYAGNVQNCTIVRNSSASGGGIVLSYGYFTNVNTIAYFNIGGASSNWSGNDAATIFTNCCTAPLRGAGTITANPQFVSLASSNFRLLKGSPCINAGTNNYSWMNTAVDLGGHIRIVDGTVDMGAYEYYPMGAMLMFH